MGGRAAGGGARRGRVPTDEMSFDDSLDPSVRTRNKRPSPQCSRLDHSRRSHRTNNAIMALKGHLACSCRSHENPSVVDTNPRQVVHLWPRKLWGSPIWLTRASVGSIRSRLDPNGHGTPCFKTSKVAYIAQLGQSRTYSYSCLFSDFPTHPHDYSHRRLCVRR